MTKKIFKFISGNDSTRDDGIRYHHTITKKEACSKTILTGKLKYHGKHNVKFAIMNNFLGLHNTGIYFPTINLPQETVNKHNYMYTAKEAFMNEFKYTAYVI